MPSDTRNLRNTALAVTGPALRAECDVLRAPGGFTEQGGPSS